MSSGKDEVMVVKPHDVPQSTPAREQKLKRVIAYIDTELQGYSFDGLPRMIEVRRTSFESWMKHELKKRYEEAGWHLSFAIHKGEGSIYFESQESHERTVETFRLKKASELEFQAKYNKNLRKIVRTILVVLLLIFLCTLFAVSFAQSIVD